MGKRSGIPHSESRIDNSIRNLKVAWICQICMIVVKFVSRRLFVHNIPDEYLGLDNLYSNVVSVLNLAELGIGVAVGYELYKPLATRDEKMVVAIVKYMATLFRRIALAVSITGMCIIPLLPQVAPEITELKFAYPAYFLFLYATSLSYFWGYKSILCSADQKNYIYTRNHYIFCITMNVVQGISLWIWKSYILYALIQFIFAIAEGIALSWVMDRNYPILKSSGSLSIDLAVKKRIWNDVKYISVGNIGNQLIASTDSIVVTKVLGLISNGVYGNYVLIISAAATIIDQILGAMTASIGNLVTTENKNKQEEIFWQLLFIQSSVYCLASACLFNTIQPFIGYWLGSQYCLDIWCVVCLIISFYLRGCRIVVNTFRKAYGLFAEDALKSCVEALGNIGLSFALAYVWGMKGVVLATIFSALIAMLGFETHKLSQKMGFGEKQYYLKMLIYMAISASIMLFSYLLCRKLPMNWYIRIPSGICVSVMVFMCEWLLLFGKKREFVDTVKMFLTKIRGNVGDGE